MGPQVGIAGVGLGLERPTPKVSALLPERNSRPFEISSRIARLKSGRTGEVPEIPGQDFSSPKTRFRQEEDNIGSVSSQYIHKMPEVSNDHNFGRSQLAQHRRLYHKLGPERCLLERTNPSNIFQVSGLHPGKEKIFFSRDAIRPLHRAQNFYQTHECGDKITETQRSQYPGVSRRSSPLVRLGNSVSATHVIGQRRIRVEGFSRQFFQKSSKTKSDFRVLGPVMEHTIRNNLAFDSTSQIYTKTGKKCHQENHSLSKAISGNSGKNKLRDNSRPTKQVLGEKLVQISKIFQKQSEETNTSSTSEKSTQVAAESEIGRKSSSESPTSISGNIHRFIPDRMGVSLISGSSEQRSVALFVHQPAYQFEGTNLRVLRTERDQSTSQHSYKGELRQHDHSLRSEEAGLGQVLTAQQLDLCCATPCSEKEDLDFGRPHTGPFQRDGRCSIETVRLCVPCFC